MPQVYNLDLETMLYTLSRRQLSGSLVAELARGKVGREPARIEVTVDSGKVVSCSLLSGRTYLTGENALQVVAQLDMIPWIFTASSNTTAPKPIEQPRLLVAPSERQAPVEKVLPSSRAPRRLGVLKQAELAQLPRSHFQVYAYVDGRRKIEDIAQQLRTTPEQIERVLADLQDWGVVQYR